jgi:acid stress-induced BolA-like protein IbaG/YrbA
MGVFMVDLKEVEKMIQTKLPNSQVMVRDLTGGGDHLEAIVISSEFEGKTKVKQHQLVYSALSEAMATEAIHALALKTFTPDTWKTVGQSLS